MRLLTAVSGVRVPQQAPQHPKGCFFHVFDRTPAINDCVRLAHTTLRTPHCTLVAPRRTPACGTDAATSLCRRASHSLRGSSPQAGATAPARVLFRVFDRTPAINDCVRPAHTTLRTPHSLTRHLLFRRVAPSPGRTECGTAQNATVARRSVFERGSTFSLRGASPPPTRQHRFNAASAWARVRL